LGRKMKIVRNREASLIFKSLIELQNFYKEQQEDIIIYRMFF